MVSAGAHSAQERTQTPLQTNLISYNLEGEEAKEWFISTPEGEPQQAVCLSWLTSAIACCYHLHHLPVVVTAICMLVVSQIVM